MYVLGKRYTNRAVSAVIAALLLIAITIAAAVLVYVFSIGLLGSLQSGGGQQVKQQVIMEAYDWSPTTALTLTIRNVGPAVIQFADVFINGVMVTPVSSGCFGGATHTLTVGTSCALNLSILTGYSDGVIYPIKLVMIDGSVFSYSAIAGSAS
jgi:flagellin-like protein